MRIVADARRLRRARIRRDALTLRRGYGGCRLGSFSLAGCARWQLEGGVAVAQADLLDVGLFHAALAAQLGDVCPPLLGISLMRGAA